MNKESNHIEQYIRKESRKLNLRKVLVAISGGADSVAVLSAVKGAGLEVRALHCNFHLRGNESDRDNDFVESLCQSEGIPLDIKHFNVSDYLLHHKNVSVEMACRDLRYDWFMNFLREYDYQRVVTGHNADDNIETFFLNLLRGSGSRGLKGMEKDNGYIWRPLLEFHREEILEYLKIRNLSFVVDSTNLEDNYRRNFIRNRVIPLLKSEWKGFNGALDKTLKNLYSENLIVEKALDEILETNKDFLASDLILNFPSPLLLIRRFTDSCGPFSTTPQEVLSAIKADKPHVRKWNLKNGTLVLRNHRLYKNPFQ